MEQQSQPKLHFWYEMLTKDPRTKCFPFLLWWWQKEDPPFSRHLFLTFCFTSLTTKDTTRTADCCQKSWPSKTEVQVEKSANHPKAASNRPHKLPRPFRPNSDISLVLNGIFLTWLHNKCLSLWVRLWPHRLVRVCNYPKTYSCQQHTIFNTSLAFRVKLTLHSQILPPRQLYPNWDFRDFISREGRSLHLWF